MINKGAMAEKYGMAPFGTKLEKFGYFVYLSGAVFGRYIGI